jgi:hypothetical protein
MMGHLKNLWNIKVQNSTDSPEQEKEHFEGLFPD